MKDLTEFRRGYKPLSGALIGAGCGLSSICFYTHGVFVAAISADMNWSRGAIQAGVSIMILMAIITAPVVGWLVDQHGARRIALVSIPLFGLTLAGLSFSTDRIQTYYAAWAIMSVLAAGTLPVTWTKTVNGWFNDFRGLALGLTLAGTGLTATFAPGYVAWLIGHIGWRHAYIALGLTVMMIAMPAVYLLFNEPAAAAKRTTNAALDKASAAGLTLKQVLTGYRFWALALGLMLVATSISGMITNLVPLLIDKGFTTANAASYAGLVGISVICGRLLAGFLVDHVWAPLIAAIFLSAPCAAAVLLGGDATPVRIGLSALIIGLAAGAELDLMAFLVSRYFGLRYYGTVYGGLYVFFSIGAGLAPAAFGWAYDVFGHYQPILNLAAMMSVAGAAFMLTLGRYPPQLKIPTRP